jgi:hypothetical protein
MQEGIKLLAVGDLVYDPYYGYGIIINKYNTNFENWQVIFSDTFKQFFIDEEQVYFLKRNIQLLVEEEENKKNGMAKNTDFWRELYSIF